MKIAVIGSNGFIGRALVDALAARGGVKLLLLGRSKSSVFGNRFSYLQVDLSDPESYREALAGIDIVYYLASESIPASSWNNPAAEIEMNLLPFISFNETAARQHVKKVCFVSSGGTVYGPSVSSVKEDADKQPFSPYGITKLAMENFLNYFRVKYNLHSDVYRVSNVYGGGQDTSRGLGIINTFLEKILTDGAISIFGDGSNVRNFIYVKDVANVLSSSVERDLMQSSVLNVSSDDTVTLNKLVDTIRGVVKEPFRVNYLESRQSDNSAVTLDNSRLKKMFSALKFTPLSQGIAETYVHVKEHISKLNS
jgi:UDP-glucose 4-epimerase